MPRVELTSWNFYSADTGREDKDVTHLTVLNASGTIALGASWDGFICRASAPVGVLLFPAIQGTVWYQQARPDGLGQGQPHLQ